MLTFIILLLFAGATAGTQHRPWLNKTLPTEERLQSFLEQLNLTQKLSMVQGSKQLETDVCIGYIPPISELGIPAICMGDGPEGVGNDLNNVTTFPAPVLITASWNESIVELFGEALAQEHKAKGRNVVLAPTINIVRSPLWGRAAESLSEDPYLNSRLGVAIVQGIQSQDMVACPKHFAAYNQETNRFGVAPEFDAIDALVDERTMHELYLPAFKAAVQEGHAGSVMCSYNKLNGVHTCESPWLYSVLKDDWGFDGFVVTDWYFAQRSTVAAALAGLDNSQPGGSWMDYYGFPDFFGELLTQAVENGSVPVSRIEDMVARLWRPLFANGVIDRPVTGSMDAMARTEEHLQLAATLVEEGAVLLKNNDCTLPLDRSKYRSVAIFGADAADKAIVTELHGGFVLDTSMVVQQPVDFITRRAAQDNISVDYNQAYPGTSAFDTIPSTRFGPTGLNVTYWNTVDWSGPVNRTLNVENITAGDYPADLGTVWPEVFSSRYEGSFTPNGTGRYYFSLSGNGAAALYLNESLVANLSGSNFGMVATGVIQLGESTPLALRLDYSMGMSVDPGAYGVTLGMTMNPDVNYEEAVRAAQDADISIIFVNDEHTEGLDSNLALRLPADQDELISRIAQHSQRTVVVLNTNSAILMPWIDQVDAAIEAFYPGQQVGSAMARLLFGDVNFSGKLPVTFPRAFNDTPTAAEERFLGVGLQANYSEGLYVGYRWFDEKEIQPLFPFGHGLSYTSFAIERMSVQAHRESNDTMVEIMVDVQNTGAVHGQEVVQLYVQFPDECDEPPRLLKGFKKISLYPGEISRVKFVLGRQDLSVWSTDWTFIPGEYTFFVGHSSRDLPVKRSIIV